MSAPAPELAVIIPYYQVEPGLLRHCVRSVLSQRGGVDVRIVIVDDESPVSADEELDGVSPGDGASIRIVRRPNGGPAAARNTGLDSLPPGTRFVAFLDSDDRWGGRFPESAVSALHRGFDLFFGNTLRVSKKRPRFAWDRDPARNLHPGDHSLIDEARGIYAFQGDLLDLLIHRSNVVSTTAMAYRFDRHSSLRFRESLFQGEDRLFKLTLGQRLGQGLGQAAFSPRIHATEGRGVNVFDQAGWGSEGSMRRTASYIRLSRLILREVRLDVRQRGHVRGRLAWARRTFAAELLHVAGRGKPVDWGVFWSTLRDDPATGALLLPNLLHLAGARFAGGRRGGRKRA